jgi:xanthine/CO dehydrogenase XdhC/CoxF family maturation factor
MLESPVAAPEIEMKDVYDIVREAKARLDEPLVLATLVRAQGSSYRRPGARLLVCRDGLTVGSLSGGCIEDEIAAHAEQVATTERPVLVDFDTRRRFGCHGKIDIFIELAQPQLFAEIDAELSARRSCTIITTPEGSFVHASAEAGNASHQSRASSSELLFEPLAQELHPPIRLLIIGAGPDSGPLQHMCRLLGWNCLDVDDANSLTIEPDRWTAAVVKSHNFGRDFAALARLLPPNLRYVGLIGPKKRRDELLNELLQLGIVMNAGFFAPAGLDLNAETPEEIALAIISEIQLVFAGGSGQSLRDQKQPIHHRAGATSAGVECQESRP